MAYGMQVFNASGALVWDSTTVTGGCAIDVVSVASGGSGTWTYPVHAGRTVAVMPLRGQVFGTLFSPSEDFGVTADTVLGYPRVTAAVRSAARTFIVFADYT